MLTTDCPFCDGEATVDDALTTVTCEGCGSTDVAPETPTFLEAAA
jgi:hypothetical protein